MNSLSAVIQVDRQTAPEQGNEETVKPRVIGYRLGGISDNWLENELGRRFLPRRESRLAILAQQVALVPVLNPDVRPIRFPKVTATRSFQPVPVKLGENVTESKRLGFAAEPTRARRNCFHMFAICKRQPPAISVSTGGLQV